MAVVILRSFRTVGISMVDSYASAVGVRRSLNTHPSARFEAQNNFGRVGGICTSGYWGEGSSPGQKSALLALVFPQFSLRLDADGCIARAATNPSNVDHCLASVFEGMHH